MQLLLLLYFLLYDVTTPSVSHFLDVPHKCKYCQNILFTLLHKSFSIRWLLLECEPMQLLLLLYVLLYDVTTPSVSHFLDVPHKCKYCQDIIFTLLHKSFSIRWLLLECEPMQLLLLLYVLLYDVTTPSVSHFLDVPHKCKYCQDILFTLLHKSFSIRWLLLECEPMQLLLLLYVLLYDVTTPSVSHFLDVPHKLSLIHSQNDIAKSFNECGVSELWL